MDKTRSNMFECDNQSLCFVKWMLLLSNILVWILGVVSVCVGIYFYTHHEYIVFVTYNHLLGLCLLTATGCLVLVIGFIGAIAVVMESVLLLHFFAFSLSFFTVLYLFGGVWTLEVDKKEVQDNLYNILDDAMKEYNSSYAYKEIWDDFQIENQCCGIDKWSDWIGRVLPTRAVPDSCCIQYSSECGITILPRGRFHEQGCFSTISTHKDYLYNAVGSLGIVIGSLQTPGIILSCILQRMLRIYKKSYTVDSADF